MPFDKTASILNTVKKTCGLGPDYDAFDQDILVFLNAAILDLTQNGIGPSDGFIVTDASQTFGDFIGSFRNTGAVATYLSQKTRLAFDPPTSSYVIDSINKTLAELIWRLNLEAESYNEDDNDFDDYQSGYSGFSNHSNDDPKRNVAVASVNDFETDSDDRMLAKAEQDESESSTCLFGAKNKDNYKEVDNAEFNDSGSRSGRRITDTSVCLFGARFKEN